MLWILGYGKGVKKLADSNKSAYIGKIKNQGTQSVQAPHQTTAQKKGNVKTGRDLRMGGGKK